MSGNLKLKALEAHRKYYGKIEVIPKVPIRKLSDFSIWYTPGVAEPARYISKVGPDESFNLTYRWNSVAVVSDGSRVLGLGNIGPEAALPVMEGKALLFKYLGGVDAIPIVLRASGAEEFINIVKALEPSFGGINLEDIESPKCFYILDRLRSELNIPVWHDDQQGTAMVVLAALINAFKLVDKDLRKSRIVLVGLGAANYSVLRYLEVYGVDLSNVIVVERPSIGILSKCHPMLDSFKESMPHWYDAALKTNRDCLEGGIPEALRGADAVIAASRPGPDIIKGEWIRLMAKKPIVFALANPVPEILPEVAIRYGAEVVATGRSDYPNQVNNSLGFPAVFRGVLTIRAKKITDSMCIEGAKALARYAERKGLRRDYIIPKMSEVGAYMEVAYSIAKEAIKEGLARRKLNDDELISEIKYLIERPKRMLNVLLGNSIIQ